MPDAGLISTLASGVHVADGAWATALRARGWPDEQPAEVANIRDPAAVSQLARDYLASGATILTTNTFSANRFALRRWKCTADPIELARAGAQLARRATGADVPIFGVVGPSGLIVALREAPEEHLAAAFAEQAAALQEGGVSGIVLETFSEAAEIQLAIRAIKDACPLPLIACMSFDSGAQHTRTNMGAEASDIARVLLDAGADGVGANCGAGIATALPAIVALRAAAPVGTPVWAKPSVGLPDLEDGRPIYPVDVDAFGRHVEELLSAGANVIGGCCGAGPEHIRRIAAMAAARRRAKKK